MASSSLALVGLFMLTLSLSGLLRDLRSVIRSKRRGTAFTSRGVIHVPFCRNIPVITLIKLVLFSIASVLAFLSTNFRFTGPEDGRFTLEALENLQLLSMVCPFLLQSVAELMSSMKWFVPDGLVDVMSAISLSWCAVILRSIENRVQYYDMIYALPANLLCLTAVMSLVEYYSNYRNFVASVLKGYFLLCFGTWVLHGSRYLDEPLDPNWILTDDNVIVDFVLTLFGCHLILGQIIIAVLYTIIYLILSGGIRRNCFTNRRRYRQLCDFL